MTLIKPGRLITEMSALRRIDAVPVIVEVPTTSKLMTATATSFQRITGMVNVLGIELPPSGGAQ